MGMIEWLEHGMSIEGGRYCRPCGEWKPLTGFYRNSHMKLGRHPTCKVCHGKRKWPQRRAYFLQERHGLTLAQFDAILAAQGGVCGLCHRPMATPAVDHCHDTGRIRGIICRTCNAGIGQLGDTVEAVERALAYLHDPPAFHVSHA